VAAAATTAPTTAPITTATAAATITHAAAGTTTPAATVMATPTRITGADFVDDDNPFLVPSSICSHESSPANRPDADTTSDGSVVHPKSRKDAQDVRAFFRQENQRQYCKFCEYVFYLSMIPAFLTQSS